MRTLTLLMLIAMAVSGCQTADDAIATSVTPVVVTGPAASAIAGDMVSRLAEQIGPSNKTSIKMNNDTTEYATALEAALKGWGYTVIPDGHVSKDQKPVEISYSLASSNGQIIASLGTSSIVLGRSYMTTTAGATPTSPLSIMRRN
jgi:type IV secretion system protein TrbH